MHHICNMLGVNIEIYVLYSMNYILLISCIVKWCYVLFILYELYTRVFVCVTFCNFIGVVGWAVVTKYQLKIGISLTEYGFNTLSQSVGAVVYTDKKADFFVVAHTIHLGIIFVSYWNWAQDQAGARVRCVCLLLWAC